MKVEGAKVIIEANLEILGGTARDATEVRQGIGQYWSGRIGGYDVSVNLTDASAPTIYGVITGTGVGGRIRGQGGSYGRGQGGRFEMQVERQNRGATRRLAAHEFGHTLGNLPHSSIAGDLMAQPPGNVVTRDNIEHLIRECQERTQPDSTKKAESKPEEN